MKRQKAHILRMTNLLLVAVAGMLLGGCAMQQSQKKLEDLEYTVVKPAEVPETLAEQIEAEKEAEFQLIYSDQEFLYIAKGYGEQETGGYSISVEECYLGEDAICVKCVLTGPKVGEQVNKAPTYPNIVLKTELREEAVVFQ